MKVAVVGGGINGLCCAWQLALSGFEVQLFERGELMQATSQASSKLLHGGLRYLEQAEFRLVHEALQERRWWLKKAPKLTRRLPLLFPLYQDSSRPRWQLKLGLMLYDFLSGKKGIGRHRWLKPEQVLRCSPALRPQGLQGAYLFFDGQMDDYKLGLWVAEQASKAGAVLHNQSPVVQLNAAGSLALAGQQQWQQFDVVVNVAGPWSNALLEQSGLAVDTPLDLVRGSHLVLPPVSRYGHMLQVPKEQRLVFVLPYQGNTLVGTTEVRQSLHEKIAVSDQERHYLLSLYNHYFTQPATQTDIQREFAGVRPLLGGSDDAGHASREYQLHWQHQVLTVSGGKWTTARALARAVVEQVRQKAL